MSSMKVNVQKNERAMLNTTINKDVLDSFKAHCISGEFVLKIGKSNKIDIKD